MTYLSDPRATDLDTRENFMHLISSASAHIKRVVRSTLAAETYQLQLTVESVDLIRAALVDIRGLLNRRDWEMSAASQIRAAWYTDCGSSYTTLSKPTLTRPSDKRLGIEIAALRQQLWRRPGQTDIDARLRDQAPEDSTDMVRWVDTMNMFTDPLTKEMKDHVLQKVL